MIANLIVNRYVRGEVYPDGPWRPSEGVQRGSLSYVARACAGDITRTLECLGNASLSYVGNIIPSIPGTQNEISTFKINAENSATLILGGRVAVTARNHELSCA
jgi:hypothetical protein